MESDEQRYERGLEMRLRDPQLAKLAASGALAAVVAMLQDKRRVKPFEIERLPLDSWIVGAVASSLAEPDIAETMTNSERRRIAKEIVDSASKLSAGVGSALRCRLPHHRRSHGYPAASVGMRTSRPAGFFYGRALRRLMAPDAALSLRRCRTRRPCIVHSTAKATIGRRSPHLAARAKTAIVRLSGAFTCHHTPQG